MNDNYVLIETKKIGSNIKNIIKKYNNYKYYIGVIKGNCYGHGFETIRVLEENGINYFAVSTIEEGIKARNYTDKPILCLQPIDICDLELCKKNNITITISNKDYYDKIKDLKLDLEVHIKVDSGMNRLGFNNKEELNYVYNDLLENKNYKLVGLYTHLGTMGLIDKKWDNQIDKFLSLTSDIDLSKIEIVHIYSSNSLVIHPKLNFCNGVRLGIIMYGVGPKPLKYNGIKGYFRKIKHNYLKKKYNISECLNDYNIDLNVGFKLISKIVEIKDCDKNEFVGYGLKYKTNKKCKVGIIPIGYADGLSLNSSGNTVLINNKEYKIIGSINMKMLTILIDKNVKVGDEVIVIGDNVREFAHHNNMTSHSTFTMIDKTIKRVYK